MTEKIAVMPMLPLPPTTSRRSTALGSSKLIIIITFLVVFYIAIPGFRTRDPNSVQEQDLTTGTSAWDWTELKASRDLEWSPCYEEFECARLDVPLDWLDPSEDDRVVLAVIKLAATDLQNYKGAVFTNPGGPSGSGISQIRDRGKALQKIIGTNHDLISFDPRGVGATIPRVDCWGSKTRQEIWNHQDVGLIDSHPGVLYDAFARSAAYSGVCNPAPTTGEGQQKTADIIRFVSTTSVARDMLEILHKLGPGKLKYWGFSYGTVLGGVFAAMYPDEVERLVSDGNVDYVEWTTCSHLNALYDSDKVMDAFYHFCHKAGPTSCDFYAETPKMIEGRLESLLVNLKVHPVIVPATSSSIDLPEIVTYSSVKRFISTSLYQPIMFFPPLARILAGLEVGNGLPFIEYMTSQGLRKPFACECKGCGEAPGRPEEVELFEDAFKAIMCTDGGGMNETVEEFQHYVDHVVKQSKSAGAVNVLFRIACAGWTKTAKWAFTGPFTGNTSHPILYIANKADNVTPLRSARENSKGFKDSVILIQNSYGHTTLSAPSMCTAKYIREYFQHGTLPKSGTECEADIEPFQAVHRIAQVKDEDSVLWSGLKELMATAMPQRGPGF